MDEIRRYMSEKLAVVEGSTSVVAVAGIMRDKRLLAVIVKDQNQYVGILTDVDITRKVVAPELDPSQTKVSSIMESPLITLDKSLPMDEALLVMKKNHIRHIVVTNDGKVVGILSIADFARYHSLNIIDPVAAFWRDSEALLDESAFKYALDKLLNGMSQKLGETSRIGMAIWNKEPLPVIIQYAEEEGLKDFADILRLAEKE